MRYINIIIAAFVLNFSLGSCTGDFEEINTNPNKNTVGTVKAYNLFEPIFYSTGKWAVSVAYTYAGPISGQFADTGHYTATAYIHQWNLAESNFQSLWDSPARYGYDCHHLIETAKKDGDTYYEALGYIFKVYHLSNLASLFGEIPYSEAYRGPSEGLKTPRFESQKDVFNHMFDELDYAVSLLKENPLPSRSGLDKLYNDNCTSWIKFVNTLKIRLLNRISNVDATAWTTIQTMLDNPSDFPVFTSIDDQASIPFTGSDPYQSHFYTGNVTSDSFTSYKLSKRVVDMMFDPSTNYADPRLYAFAQKESGESWVGTMPGTADSELKEANSKATARLNDATLNRNSASSRLLEYSELMFIIAEGVQKGTLEMSQSAKYYYEQAVRASVQTWAEFVAFNSEPMVYDDDTIDALLRRSIASYDAVAAKTSPYDSELELILSQKWLSLFWNGFEPYHEWRRNEYPIITIKSGTAVNDYEMPTRMQYPMTVRTSNSENMNAALQRMGGPNNMHTALWWSYKAVNGRSREEHIY